MRRITIWILGTISALVLLFSYRTSTMGDGRGESVSSGIDDSASMMDAAGSSPPSLPSGMGATSPGPATTATTTTGQDGTYLGSAVTMRWGTVQVKITVKDRKITDVITVQIPRNNPQDIEINDRAVPILRQQALTTQSSSVDVITGATLTSKAYRTSLQAAIDAAHI